MKAKRNQPRLDLELAIEALRADEPTPDMLAASRERGHARMFAKTTSLGSEDTPILGCEGIEGLLPAYRRGSLSAARTLLVRSHLAECANCRKVYARRGMLRLATTPWKRVAQEPASRERKQPRAFLLLAAAVTIGIAIWCLRSSLHLGSDERLATVQAISGMLYRIDPTGTNRLVPGATLTAGELVRAGDDPRSVLRLADGSAVELGERAEFSIESDRGDTTLRLNRGQIIVQAAKRTDGHLYVATRDCRVAVTGTVFSVMTDVKGSRVSVVDGQVHVAEKTGTKSVLARGQQLTTSPTIARIPIEQEIAWSRNLDDHLALLREMTELGKRWRELPSPALRYSSPLFDWAPESAFLYTALPNYGSTLSEGYAQFRARLDASPILRKWWASNPLGTADDRLDIGFEKLTELSSYLGDELVITAARHGDIDQVVALAEVKKAGIREWLESTPTPNGDALPLAIVDASTLLSGALPSGPTESVSLLVTSTFVALSSDTEALRELAMRLSVDDRGAFATTALGQRVAAAYEKGIGLLVAADLDALEGSPSRGTKTSNPSGAPPRAREGDLRFVEFEHEDVRGQTVNSGVLTFADPDRGAAAWLADPAPMGSLSFITADASAVAAFIVRNPAAVFGEIFRQVPNSRDVLSEFPEFERIWDARMSEDLRDALGAEVAVALDGPMLPIPAWKVVVEVRDRERLERTLERWVSHVNGALESRNSGSLSLEHERQGPWIGHHLTWVDGKLPIELHYAVVDGYFVATPTRTLLSRAIETRAGRTTLLDSARFASTLPRDGRAVFSGLVYQNLVPALATAVGAIATDSDPNQKRSLDEWARNSKPSLVAFYATPAQIEMVGAGDLFTLGPEALALPTLLRRILPESLDDTKP